MISTPLCAGVSVRESMRLATHSAPRDDGAVLFPPFVCVAERFDSGVWEDLWPQEQALVRDAAPRRIAEFAAGRAAARQGMAALGIAPGPIVTHAGRLPRWPDGIVGSISHSGTRCVAAVARRADCEGLGVDIECAARMTPELHARVCTPRERAWLDTLPAVMTQPAATLVFSVKEALYKAQFPITRFPLDFHDVEVSVMTRCRDMSSGTFTLRLLRPDHPWSVTFPRLELAFRISDGWTLTAVTVLKRLDASLARG